MNTAEVKYLEKLSVETTHVKSGQRFITDAPTDNNGKGEAFSPTDLVATALANCMLTVMGIKANSWGKDLENSTAAVQKVMENAPRRISEIHVQLSLSGDFSAAEKETLEKVANACPVAKSLHPDLKQNISISWK